MKEKKEGQFRMNKNISGKDLDIPALPKSIISWEWFYKGGIAYPVNMFSEWTALPNWATELQMLCDYPGDNLLSGGVEFKFCCSKQAYAWRRSITWTR